MRVAFLGFGLIGGSIARALHARDPKGWQVTAWSPTGQGPTAAAIDGTIAAAVASPGAALEGAELVVLAAPPLATLSFLDDLAGRLAGSLSPSATITDVTSTKRRLVERATWLGLPFVGGHPMAGREATGYGAADADLFVDRPWVVCPEGGPEERLALVERLARAAGARPVRLPAVQHDAAVAAISHLPLVASAALVEAVASRPDWPAVRALAASGWRDATRLARGDVDMGAGIAATNADEIANGLRGLRDAIDGWLADLGDGQADPERLRRRLAAAREHLEAEPEPDAGR